MHIPPCVPGRHLHHRRDSQGDSGWNRTSSSEGGGRCPVFRESPLWRIHLPQHGALSRAGYRLCSLPCPCPHPQAPEAIPQTLRPWLVVQSLAKTIVSSLDEVGRSTAHHNAREQIGPTTPVHLTTSMITFVQIYTVGLQLRSGFLDHNVSIEDAISKPKPTPFWRPEVNIDDMVPSEL